MMLFSTFDMLPTLMLLFTYVASEANISSNEIVSETDDFENCFRLHMSSVYGTNCKNYYYCKFSWGRYTLEELTCLSGLFYDPKLQKCSNDYTCTETNTYVTDEYALFKNEHVKCIEAGIYPVEGSCKKYYQCIVTTNTFEYIELECPEHLNFDRVLRRCNILDCEEFTSTEETPRSTNATEAYPITTEVDEFICTEQGRFPLPDSDCSKYRLCVKTSTGFKSQDYSCPGNNKFDPVSQTCTKSYICPEYTTTSSTVETTPILEEPQCEATGKFLVSNTNCKKYLLCVRTSTGFRSREYECPGESLFNPIEKYCSNSYVCLEGTDEPQTTENSETTTKDSTKVEDEDSSSTTEHLESEQPRCETQGKFPITRTNCKSYLLCVSTSTGFKSKQYECPGETYFDPKMRRCSASYQCTDTESSTEDNSLENTSSSNENQSSSTTSSDGTNVTSSTEGSPHNGTNNSTTSQGNTETTTLPTSECLAAGRFPVVGTNCTKYMLCVATKNGLRSIIYTCPQNYYFNPDLKTCSNSYKCEELSTTVSDIGASTSSTSADSSQELNDDNLETTKNEMNFTIPSTTLATVSEIPTTAETEVTTPIQCTSRGRFPIPGTECRNFLLCIPTSAGMKSKVYTCPNNTHFDPSLGMCSSSYACPELTITTTTETAPSGDLCPDTVKLLESYIASDSLYRTPRFLQNGRCTTVGRYLVANTHCKQYVFCRANADGSLTGINYVCPTTTVFNQVIQKCSSLYKCPDDVCFAPGPMPNPNVNDCSSYIECQTTIVNGNTVLTGTVQVCAMGTYYNPLFGMCDPNYVCIPK